VRARAFMPIALNDQGKLAEAETCTARCFPFGGGCWV
jgi:hypothetical protein